MKVANFSKFIFKGKENGYNTFKTVVQKTASTPVLVGDPSVKIIIF